ARTVASSAAPSERSRSDAPVAARSGASAAKSVQRASASAVEAVMTEGWPIPARTASEDAWGCRLPSGRAAGSHEGGFPLVRRLDVEPAFRGGAKRQLDTP